MTSYVPFLKTKGGEFKAIKMLRASEKHGLIPFFDIPKQDENITESLFIAKVRGLVRKFDLNLGGVPSYYVDNKDISDRFLIKGVNNYRHILEAFYEHPIIPVSGVNRDHRRRQVVVDACRDRVVSSESVAVRLDYLDIESYAVVRNDFESLVSSLSAIFEKIILVFDLGVVEASTVPDCITRIERFFTEASRFYSFERTIIAGSSIPASIRDIAKSESEETVTRHELSVYDEMVTRYPGALDIGDYTIVSPYYSEAEIPVQAMQKVTAPKLIYSFDQQHFVIRGGALSTHPRGFSQYYDLCSVLVGKRFFRPAGYSYSYGDGVFDSKSRGTPPNLTPANSIGPMVNAHITYMLRTYSGS